MLINEFVMAWNVSFATSREHNVFRRVRSAQYVEHSEVACSIFRRSENVRDN